MRFVLRDKLFSIGGDLAIQDDRGREVYYVDGKLISIGRRLEIKDSSGHVVATIQRRIISLRPTYEISLPHHKNVTISKALFSPFIDRLKIDVPGPGDLDVHGDLFDHEYSIDLHGREVARVSKRWISLVDAYGIEIDESDVDPLVILASAVVIDQILHEEREEHHE
jgi:uncharacterized protein YxjI